MWTAYKRCVWLCPPLEHVYALRWYVSVCFHKCLFIYNIMFCQHYSTFNECRSPKITGLLFLFSSQYLFMPFGSPKISAIHCNTIYIIYMDAVSSYNDMVEIVLLYHGSIRIHSIAKRIFVYSMEMIWNIILLFVCWSCMCVHRDGQISWRRMCIEKFPIKMTVTQHIFRFRTFSVYPVPYGFCFA